MDFPVTEDEFAALAAQGQTVVYEETADDTPPEGDGWSYWGPRTTGEETAHVWRKIVPIGATQ